MAGCGLIDISFGEDIFFLECSRPSDKDLIRVGIQKRDREMDIEIKRVEVKIRPTGLLVIYIFNISMISGSAKEYQRPSYIGHTPFTFQTR